MIDDVLSGKVRWGVVHGDALEVLRTMPDASVDAVVTDPPYGLSSEPDATEVLRHWLNGDDYQHQGGGFMGRTWDSFVPGPSIWRKCLRVLKPGGHLLAFGGTRTFDLQTLAIRIAGFEIRDSISWIYGSGFPKSMNVSKAIDNAAGATREILGTRRVTRSLARDERTGDEAISPIPVSGADIPVTAPATDEAKRWSGWGTALKPAHDPIVLARKPFKGTVAENVIRHGVGALNIDACRVGFANEADEAESKGKNQHADFESAPRENHVYGKDNSPQTNYNPPGRWPPNLLFSHSEECVRVGTKRVAATSIHGDAVAVRQSGVHAEAGDHQTVGREQPVHGYADADGKESVPDWRCAPGCPVAELDAQSGTLTSGALTAEGKRHSPRLGTNAYGQDAGRDGAYVFAGDTGGASRFFPNFTPDAEDNGALFIYQAKAAKRDREAGLEPGDKRANTHPTVKSTALMSWLVRLITPPGGIVLDPFTGSGSTGRGALLEGFRFIGIEREDTEREPFVTIARRRIADAEKAATPADNGPKQGKLL